MSSDESEFPFDFWARLAENDPATFEEARRLVIDSMIESAPERNRPRLRGLQWQIDAVRDRAGSPLGACVRLSGMMWQTLLGEQGLVDHMRQLAEGLPGEPPAGHRSATLLRFRRDPA